MPRDGPRSGCATREGSATCATTPRAPCARPWSWHKNQFAGAEWAYVRFDCFSGLYIASLLEHKHGIAPSARVVTIARHLNGSLVDWTSGSLLYEVALRPQGPVPPWGGDTD